MDAYKKRNLLFLLLTFLLGSIFGNIKTRIEINRTISKHVDEINKFREFYGILNYWLTLKEEGKSLESFFIRHNYKVVAIYGMKDLGIHLLEELRNSSINVSYGIDKNADCTYTDIDVYSDADNLPKADVIVVTAVHYFDEIKEELEKHVDIPIISLADILKEV